MATVVANQQTGAFVLADTSVTSTSVFASSDILSIPETMIGRPIMIQAVVGAADAIGHMDITFAMVRGGTHGTISSDLAGTATNLFPFSTTNAYSSAASAVFHIIIAYAPAEVIFKFKKVTANTTVSISGTVGAGARVG